MRASNINEFYNDVSCLPDQQAKLDFYSAMSLKQQSKDRRVTPLGYIILILSPSVFDLTP